MDIIKTVLYILAAIYLLGLFVFALMSRKPLKLILLNAFSGLVLLILSAISGKYLGFSVFINIYTLTVSAFWGIPGVIILILISAFI